MQVLDSRSEPFLNIIIVLYYVLIPSFLPVPVVALFFKQSFLSCSLIPCCLIKLVSCGCTRIIRCLTFILIELVHLLIPRRTSFIIKSSVSSWINSSRDLSMRTYSCENKFVFLRFQLVRITRICLQSFNIGKYFIPF